MLRSCAVPTLLLLAGCATRRDWREIRTGPATRAEAYDAVEFLARTDGFAPSQANCDRGLGTWSSRWRYRQVGLGRPGRYRLQAEVLLEDGSHQAGWIVRYLVEQQKVKDLARSREPVEDDWDADGQDIEREYLFGQRLIRRLGSGAQTGREPQGDPQDRQ